MTDFDDDILESFEDDNEQALSQADIEKRQAVFEAEVKRRIRMLAKPRDFKPAERLAAARWLGEAGDVRAIKPLVTVYKKDRTKGMKETAAYALGQFKALEDALDDPELMDMAYDKLDGIVLRGEFGKPARNFTRTYIGLGVSFVVLLVIGLLLGTVGGDSADGESNSLAAQPTAEVTLVQATPTPDTAERQAELLQSYFTDLDTDTRILQEQFGAIGRGEPPNCAAVFNDPAEFSLSPVGQDDANLVDIMTRLNALRQTLLTARDPFERSCEQNILMDRQQALELGGQIVDAQRELNAIVNLFEGTSVVLPTSEFIPTDTPAPTAMPTLAVEAVELRPHILTLQSRITEMISLRGPTTRIVQFWQELVNNGTSIGCNQPDPIIPDDYTDLPDEVRNMVPELGRATDNVNLGLELTRQAWAAFRTGCNSDNLAEQATRQLEVAQLAQSAFEDAQTNLDSIPVR